MKFNIHFEHPDGTEDHVVVNGNTIGEIQEKAGLELARRRGTNPWSEEVVGGD